MEARLQQATLADRDLLFDFIRGAYGPLADHKVPHRWDWQYADNPFITETELPIWLAERDSEWVGMMCASPVPMQVGAKEVKAAWAVDLVVLPAARRSGIGGRLHKAEEEHYPLLMKLTMAAATRRMAERAGCVHLAPVPKYSRWTRLRAAAIRRYLLVRTRRRPGLQRLVRGACRILLAHHLLAWGLNSFLALRDIVKGTPRADEETEIYEVERFGADLDRLWEATRDEWGVICPRNSAFADWRFRGYPGLQYRRFMARRDGEVRGYVVLRSPEPEELDTGLIVDLYASRHDSATVQALVSHAVHFFGRSVSAIGCATTIPEYQSVLEGHGFFVTHQQRPTCVSHDPELKAEIERLKDDWFLSAADHDWDQVQPALPEGTP